MTLSEPIRQGKELLEQLQFEESEAHFRGLLTQEDYHVDALVWLARLHLMREDMDRGLEFLEQALEKNNQNAEALALKAAYHMQNDAFAEALPLLEEARSIDPELPMVYGNLAPCYREFERLAEAEEAARKAIELEPENYQSHYELSHVLAMKGEIASAIRSVLKTLQLNPLHITAYLTLGTLYNQVERFGQTIELYEEGLRHNPNAHILRDELVDLYLLVQKPREAYLHAESLTQRRDFFGDYLRLGKCALAIDEFEKAEQAFLRATQLNPQHAEASYHLGEIYMAAGLFEEAKEQYKKAIAVNDQNFIPYNAMGQTLLHENKPEEARDWLLQAHDLAPKRVEPALNLALCLTLLGDTDNARLLAQAVVDAAEPGTHNHDEAARLLQELH